MSSLNWLNSLMELVLKLTFYRWTNQDRERLNHVTKVTRAGQHWKHSMVWPFANGNALYSGTFTPSKGLWAAHPWDVGSSTYKPFELGKICISFEGKKKNSVQAHSRMGGHQNQQPPKIAHKTRCQPAEMQARKNGAPRERGCGCFQHIVTVLMTASFVLKRIWAAKGVTTNRLQF